MFLSDDVGGISLQNPVGSCFDFADPRGRTGDDEDLADTQGRTAHSIGGLYGFGGGPETVGDFPEGIALSNRITLRTAGGPLGGTFFRRNGGWCCFPGGSISFLDGYFELPSHFDIAAALETVGAHDGFHAGTVPAGNG